MGGIDGLGELADLTGRVGTEVRGIQLVDLPARRIEIMAQLVAQRGVLVFRNQRMDLDAQLALGERLGPLHVHPIHGFAEPTPALRIYTDGDSKYVPGDHWHSDVSWDECPPALSILRIETSPPAGGDTVFTSTTAAVDALSVPMRSFLESLSAVHVYRNVVDREPPAATHPVVRTHPRTGQSSLYVNAAFTERIEGLSPAESGKLLEFLFDHIARSVDHQCRVRWEPQTVTIWDNRCTQHHATWDFFPATRSGWRVSVRGERPYFDASRT